MLIPLEKATAYLDRLEADRQAAIALSEQKAEEAKLIKARQEGFQAALEMLEKEIFDDNARSDSNEPGQRRSRRHIPHLIMRELSFSGQAMTARQIAKAIDYNLERTQTALTRMEEAGQVLRNGEGRWVIGITAGARPDEHAAGNGFLTNGGRP
jgi:predicted Rossmann fold nucleotide-binding protein DprA/Smf involved in DNA uptake